MNLRLPFRRSDLVERVRTSLFFVPMVYVVAGVVLGQLGLVADGRLDLDGRDLPVGMTSTVESARSVLTTVASATMTVAGIAFSISLLILQLASSQYSPRVVHGLFRDPKNKQVMGIVLGTFTYCLVVLRGVHAPVEAGGDAVIPTISVSAGVVFGIAAVVAIVAFINHNAHATDVSTLLDVTTSQAVDQARENWSRREDGADEGAAVEPSANGHDPGVPSASAEVRAATRGWVRDIDTGAMLEQLEPGQTFRCEVTVGDYVACGQVLGARWPVRSERRDEDDDLGTKVVLGTSRTIQNDPLYGVRQLVDVALRALSTGVNDPTTAEDAIVHLSDLVQELLVRTPPPRVVEGEEGRRVLLPARVDHADVVRSAFDELRRESTTQPRIAVALIDAMRSLVPQVDDAHTLRTLDMLAFDVLDGARSHLDLTRDLDRVEQAFAAYARAVDGGHPSPVRT